MPSACATLRASATACGPQHLSSAREMQSCGHTFIVTPTTSYPCCFSKYAATLESTPPLIPTTTRGRDDELCCVTGDDCMASKMAHFRLFLKWLSLPLRWSPGFRLSQK